MIGISLHSGAFVDKPLPWVIEHLGSLGYDGIEIVCGPTAHIRTGEPLEPQLDDAKRLLAENNLKVAAINPYTHPSMAPSAKQDRQETIAFWSQLMDIAVELGARNVNFLPGWLPDGDREAWQILIDVLKPLAKRADGMGLNLAIHNHEGQIIDSPDKCLLLIEQVGSPALKVLCDITNFHILGGDVAQAVERVGPYIVHCHEKGVKGKYPFNEFIVVGDEGDELPIDDFYAALGRLGYDAYVSMEGFSWMRDDKAVIAYNAMSERLRALNLRP